MRFRLLAHRHKNQSLIAIGSVLLLVALWAGDSLASELLEQQGATETSGGGVQAQIARAPVQSRDNAQLSKPLAKRLSLLFSFFSLTDDVRVSEGVSYILCACDGIRVEGIVKIGDSLQVSVARAPVEIADNVRLSERALFGIPYNACGDVCLAITAVSDSVDFSVARAPVQLIDSVQVSESSPTTI